MGELLRRYWQPVCTSDELRDLPKKIKLLCEELVVFRDKKGRVGALDPHCSHRGTSLEWGRVEEEGLRCCYHGWLYDTQGQCIDMPCETEEFRERVDVWHPAYPAMEYGGLVFVYMGPPGTEPLFPMYDIIDTRYRKDVVLRGMRLWGEYSVGFVKDCNWLQHYENIVDPWHLLMLHQMISGDQFEGALMQGAPQIGFENTPLGVRYRVVKDLPNGNRFVRHAECVVPNAFLIPNIRETGTTRTELPGRWRTASQRKAGGPAQTRSRKSGRVRCCREHTRSVSANPMISRLRKVSGSSPYMLWKISRHRTRVSPCCGTHCASRSSG
jgi:phenylpropionate dioxygenase-like ring-hydroxylating dioxygenase large terminal subunit